MDETLSIDEVIALGTAEIAAFVAELNGDIDTLVHPVYTTNISDWQKWRLTYASGQEYIVKYLEQFSERESNSDFLTRRDLTYCPAFARASVNEVKDAIFQRIAEVNRDCPSNTYTAAVIGETGGVDLAGTTMNSFIGLNLLPEMLSMSKVGVFIDMPVINGPTLADAEGFRPYMYYYKAEDILNWEVSNTTGMKFTKLLLRDTCSVSNNVLGLPSDTEMKYRYMWVRGGYVLIQFFNKNSEPITRHGTLGIDVQVIEMDEIPFVLFDIADSLLRDVADYQRVLLNLASSDIAFIAKANFPFYVEKYDPRYDNSFSRRSSITDESGARVIEPGEKADASEARTDSVKVGTVHGRRVPQQFDYPQYIHPSSEPLKASMIKQEELKNDIRLLVKLAVSSLAPKMASAESKGYDERSLDAGLSAIGLALEHGEKNICRLWMLYEATTGPATVKYPARYSLQTDKDKRQEAVDLIKSVETSPSIAYKREAHKLAVVNMIGRRASDEVLDTIFREIDSAAAIVSSSEELQRDVELTLVDPETASLAKGYPAESHAKAIVAHAERVKRIAESQAKARGTPDLGGMEDASRAEKMEKDEDGTPSRKTRGEA